MSFLTDTDLEKLTGYTQPAAQIRYLQRWQIHHYVNALGRPVVPVESIQPPAEGRGKKPRKEPNFDAIKKAG